MELEAKGRTYKKLANPRAVEKKKEMENHQSESSPKPSSVSDMYMHYFKHRKSAHLKVHPKKSYKELQSIIQNEWDQMPQEEK